MKLILPADYVKKAAADIRRAHNRVFLISMVIADHPETHELIAELEAAARRGVDVTVTADVFTYGEISGGFLPIRYYSSDAKLVTKMVKTLKGAGVKFHWLGHARATILSGRTHSKWCVVDDVAYVFGGVNMYGGGIENVDYMFRVQDARLADRLVHEQGRIIRSERAASNFPSVMYEHGDSTILFDGGVIGQSVIYRRACELASEAKEILFVSQYCPTGKLSRILKRKRTRYYFNRPEQASLLNRVLIRFSMATSGLKTSYRKKRYLHAKFIIFTMPDGSQVALTGSHNFAYTGVLLGTREVALETKEPAVIRQLQDFFSTHVA